MAALTPLRSRRLRSLRALWRSFCAAADTDAARAFGRALAANVDAAMTALCWTVVAFGLVYFVVRGLVSLRWGV